MDTSSESAQHILWHWLLSDEPGLEHLILNKSPDLIHANGLIIGISESFPFRLRYYVNCDTTYQFQQAEVVVEIEGKPEQAIQLERTITGEWRNRDGKVLPFLRNCTEIDIQVSPFTNTLPIRRLEIQVGAVADVRVVYITIPMLELSVEQQRYTRLADIEESQRYRFESLDTGFTTEIKTDRNGLVVDYPDIWRRVW
jgi:hypothetical protein